MKEFSKIIFNLEDIYSRAKKDILEAKTQEDLKRILKKYLGKEGEVRSFTKMIKKFPPQERKETGRKINIIKNEIEKILSKKEKIVKKSKRFEGKKIDVTAPGKKIERGHLHPLTLVKKEVEEIFQSMGFSVVEGPEIETEWYNFDALNIPKEHPARDMWDTLWLKEDKLLLRTHATPVDVRYMEKHNPPLRIITVGRIFRHEATDFSHEINFYQLEGLMVDENISVANFKAVIQEFLKRFFKDKKIQMRLRPSFFPFTKPSFEIDILYERNKEKKWIETLGAGMVHPNVFLAAGLNPKQWQGFAFGLGLDRLAMIKYKVPDIRLFYSGDLRFLYQF